MTCPDLAVNLARTNLLKAKRPDAGFRDITQDGVNERIAASLMAAKHTRSTA